ncbi:MAG TPA: hypothetical protein ENK60_07415 [Anaerolineae bacterium]|nr:hypothetical protein [Anaerolineae bacterium]
MVKEPNHLAMELSPEEQEMIGILQEALGLPNKEEVIRLLVKQAIQRIAITCPTCGHYARLTEEGKAECKSCLSVIHLAEDILLTTGDGS